jgi:hypothetical protein
MLSLDGAAAEVLFVAGALEVFVGVLRTFCATPRVVDVRLGACPATAMVEAVDLSATAEVFISLDAD